MLIKALELAAQINHPTTAAIFAAVLALAALLSLTKGKRRMPPIAWILALIIFVLGMAPLLADTYLNSRGIYRVRIQVLNPSSEPVHDAEIASSAGGELKETDAGWEFTIPREEIPLNGEVTFRAAQKDAFLAGHGVLRLQRDYFPQLSIRLVALPSVNVTGMVEDENGHPIDGVRIWVLSHDETVVTGLTGSFSLPAYAADGEQITLVAQKGNNTTQAMAVAGRTVEVVLGKSYR